MKVKQFLDKMNDYSHVRRITINVRDKDNSARSYRVLDREATLNKYNDYKFTCSDWEEVREYDDYTMIDFYIGENSSLSIEVKEK